MTWTKEHIRNGAAVGGLTGLLLLLLQVVEELAVGGGFEGWHDVTPGAIAALGMFIAAERHASIGTDKREARADLQEAEVEALKQTIAHLQQQQAPPSPQPVQPPQTPAPLR